MGLLHGWQPSRPVFPAISGGSGGAPAAPQGLGPSSRQMLPDLPRGCEQWGRDGPREDRGQGHRDRPEGRAAGKAGRPSRPWFGASCRAGVGTNLALALSSSVTLVADAALGVAATTDLLRGLAVAS